MQTFSKQQTGTYIVASLAAVSFIMIFALFLGKDVAKVVENWIFIPVPGATVVLSILFALRNGMRGNHGKAWFLFSLSVTSWFIGEQVWFVYDLVYNENPFPSLADFFYLMGYAFFFAFSLYYLKPVKNAITKKIVLTAIAISMALLVPTVYYSLNNTDYNSLELALAASYPILDVVTLAPAMIGIVLFLGGKVNFMWTLVMLGMLIFVIADTGFLVTNLDGEYYTGHPVDILYLWSYLLFAFGVRDQMKIFKKSRAENRFNKQEELR